MKASLRPMNLGEILDRTFQIYRSRFLVFAGIGTIPALAMTLARISNELWWKVGSQGNFARIFGLVNMGWMLSALLLFHSRTLFDFLVSPCVVHLVSGEVFESKCSFSSAIRKLVDRWLANVGLALLLLACVLILPEIAIVLLEGGLAALAEVANIETAAYGPIWSPMMTVGILLGVAAFFGLSSLFGLSWCTCRLEGLSSWHSLGRSRRLSRGARSRILAAQFVSASLWLVLCVAFVATLEFILLGLRAEGVRHIVLQRTSRSAILIGQFFISSLLCPLYPIALTLIYYDQRIRREGFDIEWMMSAAGLNVPAVPPAGTSESVPESIPTPAETPVSAAIAPAGPLAPSTAGPLI